MSRDNGRSVTSPTLLTPHRPAKRRPLRERVEGVPAAPTARVSLLAEFQSRGRFISWSKEEVKALVEYILLMCNSQSWPTHHRMHFWKCASEFIERRTNSRHSRSGMYSPSLIIYHHVYLCSDFGVRSKVVGLLAKTPLDAERELLTEQESVRTRGVQTDQHNYGPFCGCSN